MAEYIDRDIAVSIIEEQQKFICPMDLYSRNAVYGTDRERFDAWSEIIGQIKAIPATAVAPVVHGRWIGKEIDIETGDISATLQECSVCHRVRPVDWYCSHCGTKMDKEDHDGLDTP